MRCYVHVWRMLETMVRDVCHITCSFGKGDLRVKDPGLNSRTGMIIYMYIYGIMLVRMSIQDELLP